MSRNRRRGLKTSSLQRLQIISLIDTAVKYGARVSACCDVLEFSSRTYQRWKKSPFNEDLRKGPKHSPSKLTEDEISEIVTILSSKEFVDLPACQIVPRLADKGIYCASEASIYRIIKKYGLGKHRSKSKRPRKVAKPKPAIATAPNQVWTWDITYLPTKVKGQFVYLYLFLDLFSRKIVGWRIHEEQSSEHSSALIRECMFKENITGRNLKLHSDNGGPMKSCMMLSTLQELGVMPSFSRPSVSNDNPYSEAMFKTVKYCPTYPLRRPCNIEEWNKWFSGFEDWYNKDHYHSKIKYVSPNSCHELKDSAILENRKAVYELAKSKTPNRWNGRNIRNWNYIPEVYLNPSQKKVA